MILGVGVGRTFLAYRIGEGINRRQIARLFFDRSAKMGGGLRELALLFRQETQQGLDGAAIRRERVRPREFRRGLLEIVFAQIQQPQIGPARWLPGNQFDRPPQVLAGKVLAPRFQGRHADLERTLSFLI